ncbi:MAG: BolA family protein [Methylococcales bacterium]
MTSTVEIIKTKLTDALSPDSIDIIDDSQAHAGHAGQKQHGGGHYNAIIVATAFEGKNHVQRHQLVYKALGEMMQTEIHALRIKAYSPNEIEIKQD